MIKPLSLLQKPLIFLYRYGHKRIHSHADIAIKDNIYTLSIFFSCFYWSKSFEHVFLKYLGENHNIIKRNQSTWLVCHLVRLSLNQTGHEFMLNHHLDQSVTTLPNLFLAHTFMYFFGFLEAMDTIFSRTFSMQNNIHVLCQLQHYSLDHL